MKHTKKATRFVTTILSALVLCVWGLSGFLCFLRHLTVWAVQKVMAAMLPKKMISKVLTRPAFSHVLLEKLWKQDENVVALSMQLESRDCPHGGAQADESTDHGSFLDGSEGEGHERVPDSDVPVHADAQGDEDAAVHVYKVKTLQGGAKHRPQVPVVLEVVGNDFKRKSKQQQSIQEYKGYHVDCRF